MFDIATLIPGRVKRASKGWLSFNAVCCHHRGHSRADTKRRAGIKRDGDTWVYHCFNCGFSTGYEPGKTFSKNTRLLLKWMGVEDKQIIKWNMENVRRREILGLATPKASAPSLPEFNPIELPPHELLDENNPTHAKFVDYLKYRGLTTADYPFLVTPGEDDIERNKNRILIPLTHENKIVGHVSRYLDDRNPKYIKIQPEDYLFGLDLQKPEWQVCLLFEGHLDALPLNGCALSHNTITKPMARQLFQLRKRIIVVPDQDEAGFKLIGPALNFGFQVSIPDWGPEIKDANQACVKYGRLPTLLSIIQAATNNKVEIKKSARDRGITID